MQDTLFNTDTVVEHGLAACFEDASTSGRAASACSTSPPELWEAELASVTQARAVALRPYNDYRELAKFPRAHRVRGRSPGTAASRTGCASSTASVDEVEFYPGLFAEDVRAQRGAAVADRPHGRDRRLLAGLHQPAALAARVQPRTFSPLGWDLIRTTGTLSDLLHRNIPDAGRRYEVTMTRRDWVRS